MRSLLLMAILIWLGSCQTAPSSTQSLTWSDLMSHSDDLGVIPVPYRYTGQGLMVIDVNIDGVPMPMFLDTGATKSALFEDFTSRLTLDGQGYKQSMIHGLDGKNHRPLTTVSKLTIGNNKIRDLEIAILPKRDYGEKRPAQPPGGLLGMDVLSEYVLVGDAGLGLLYFIPNDQLTIKTPQDWGLVPLVPSVPGYRDWGLHFLEVRIADKLFIALLDTGSDINVINWESGRSVRQIRDLRRRLHDDWEYQGAVGKFDPIARVSVKNMRAGQKIWDQQEFFIMNTDSLEVMGVKTIPFAITGAPILQQQSFVMNFSQNELWLKGRQTRALQLDDIYDDGDGVGRGVVQYKYGNPSRIEPAR